jgi:hypothetical protein
VGRCRREGRQKWYLCEKRLGNCSVKKVRIAFLKQAYPGANSSNRRPTDAGESVDPSELPASDEPMSCIHDGRLDSAYASERDPGVGHAACR